MSQTNPTVSGGDNMAEETVVPPVENPPADVPPKEELVPVKAYDEVKNDMLKYKAELRKRETELEQAKAKQKELELAGLRAKEDYKAMFEDADNRLKETEGKLKQTQSAIVDSTKWSSISSELLSLGLIPSSTRAAEKLVDLDQLDIETTSHGRYNVLNAKTYAEKFKAEHPYLFNDKKVNINNGVPPLGTPGKMDLAQLNKLQQEWQKTRTPESEKAYRTALMAMKASH